MGLFCVGSQVGSRARDINKHLMEVNFGKSGQLRHAFILRSVTAAKHRLSSHRSCIYLTAAHVVSGTAPPTTPCSPSSSASSVAYASGVTVKPEQQERAVKTELAALNRKPVAYWSAWQISPHSTPDARFRRPGSAWTRWSSLRRHWVTPSRVSTTC